MSGTRSVSDIWMEHQGDWEKAKIAVQNLHKGSCSSGAQESGCKGASRHLSCLAGNVPAPLHLARRRKPKHGSGTVLKRAGLRILAIGRDGGRGKWTDVAAPNACIRHLTQAWLFSVLAPQDLSLVSLSCLWSLGVSGVNELHVLLKWRCNDSAFLCSVMLPGCSVAVQVLLPGEALEDAAGFDLGDTSSISMLCCPYFCPSTWLDRTLKPLWSCCAINNSPSSAMLLDNVLLSNNKIHQQAPLGSRHHLAAYTM